jgi:hypothetical protein
MNPQNSSNPCAFGPNSGLKPRCHLPMSPVAYPLFFSSAGSDAPVTGSPRAESAGLEPSGHSMPQRCWYCPLMRPVLVGEQLAPLA